MVGRIMFYLNRNKEHVLDTVQHCTALCRQRGIVPLYFREDAAFLAQCMDIDPDSLFDAPEQAKTDMLFVCHVRYSCLGCKSWTAWFSAGNGKGRSRAGIGYDLPEQLSD